MVPKEIEEKNSFNPKYYIVVDHGSVHYRLITYKGLSILQFHELPWELRDKLVKKCMHSKGKNMFEWLTKSSLQKSVIYFFGIIFIVLLILTFVL